MPHLPIAGAVVDLTPSRPVPMGGFKGPERLTLASEGRLEANILALGSAANRCVFVSIDALFVGAPLRDRILAACRGRFGVGADRVLILASHTHFAPMLDEAKPQLGRADRGEIARWGDRIAQAIHTAEEVASEAARSGCMTSDAAVNRRLRWRWPSVVRLLGKTDGGIYMCDNPEGPRDPRIRTWTYLAPDGAPIAVVWSFACHPVFFPAANTASPDYVGRVRTALRARLGAGVPVVFAPGCMGDIWPRSSKPWKSLRRAASLAIYGPAPLPVSWEMWEQWAVALSSEVVSAECAGTARTLESVDVRASKQELAVSAIFDGYSPVETLTAKAVHAPGLGDVVALSCEPVTQIASTFARHRDALILGYEGDVFGYLPTDAIVAEGGYEPKLSLAPFGLRGRFRPGIDDALRSLAASLTRTL